MMNIDDDYYMLWMESHMWSKVTHALRRARLLANGLPHLQQPLKHGRTGVTVSLYDPFLHSTIK